MKSLINKTYIISGITILIYAFCLLQLGRNLSFDTLTYDEAGQFFISKGLNHYSEPYSTSGSIADVIHQNTQFNQDPGGFSILLHYWSEISDSIVWLRMLPFIFFIGAICFTCLTVFKITKHKLISSIAGLLLFALWGGHIPYELRPYSMELCGMAYGLWLIFYIRSSHKLTKTALLFYSLVLSLFITARYTIIMFAGVYTLFILQSILNNKHREPCLKERLKACTCFSIPLLCSVAYSYFFALRIQNSTLQPWSYIVYLSTQHWPFKLYTLGFIIAISTIKWQNKKTRLLTIIFISINILFIILGYCKLLPWTFIGHKGAAFIWLWYITLYCVTLSILSSKIGYREWFSYIYLGFSCILIMFSNHQFHTLGLWEKSPLNITRTLSDIPSDTKPPILVCETLNPSIRFYYEYTKSEKHGFIYPNDFIFLKGPAHTFFNIDSISNYNNQIKNSAAIGTIFLSVFSYTGEDYTPLILSKNTSDSFTLLKTYR